MHGYLVTEDSSKSMMFGYFSLWNGTWVGCMLKIDPITMQPSIYNSGIIGGPITSMTYFNNDTEVAMIGSIFSFQKNPTMEVHQVAACSADGVYCYPLGAGLDDFAGYTGVIKVSGDTLFAFYMQQDAHPTIETFNTSFSQDPTQEWTKIFSSDWTSVTQVTIEIYMDSLWLFGCIWVNKQHHVAAARWNSAENSWEYMYDTQDFCDAWDYSNPITTVSPDGQSVYLQWDSYPSQIFTWNNTLRDWQLFMFSGCYYPVIAARNDGLLMACNSTVRYAENGEVKELLPELECQGAWIQLTVNSKDTHLYAFCQDTGLLTLSYNFTQENILAGSSLSNFEAFTISSELCVYGQKMVLTGPFDRVGNTTTSGLALWDDQYKQWYQLHSNISLVCHCSTNGYKMAAVCSSDYHDAPTLFIDYADTDSGAGPVNQIQRYTVTEMPPDFYYTQQIQVTSDGDIYFGINLIDGTKGFYKWSLEEGATSILLFKGSQFLFNVEDDIAFIVGEFFNDTNSTEPVSAARYSLSNNTWLPMDQITKVDSGVTFSGDTTVMSFWNATGLLYVGGFFSSVGTMRVSNWAGYDMDGQGADSVQGGVPSWVLGLAPLGERMYLLVQASDCLSETDPDCRTVIYYDSVSHTYSNTLARGAGCIAVGSKSSDSSSSDSKDFSVIVIPIVVAGVLVVMVLVVAIFYRKVIKGKRSFYQEIPEISSVESAGPIDFQHEEFVMKSVLGRGAYGTVWSCVFPHREAATYAVKQMLYSKGDTKKIEIVKQEISILEKLRHPYLVHYCGHRVEMTDTSVEFFIFMELYEQPCSLKGVIQKRLKQAQKTGKNQWFTYKELKKYLYQMAEALHYLHSEGIAHRDLKCANLLIRTKGTLVNSLHIADFGISKIMDSQESGVSPLASTMLGTPLFMAPGTLTRYHFDLVEILKNQLYDPFKADMWSFGMTMYEMLSWQDPEIPGKKPTFPEQTLEYLKSDDQFKSILEIFDRCLQQEPIARPDAAELLNLCENLP